MLAHVRSKVTYANVVASLALFLALGGISYAAIQIPKSSVGSKQLKADAVTSAKVKDGTLQKADFAPGGLPAAGANGRDGTNGRDGAKGDRGTDGADATDPPDPANLLDPRNYLPATERAEISIDGFEIAEPRVYRIDCANVTCTLSIGLPVTDDMELNGWHELAMTGDVAAARKTFTLTKYTAGGATERRYHVEDGVPTAKRELNERLEMTFSADLIQRVAP
jgi:hypothetical protein